MLGSREDGSVVPFDLDLGYTAHRHRRPLLDLHLRHLELDRYDFQRQSVKALEQREDERPTRLDDPDAGASTLPGHRIHSHVAASRNDESLVGARLPVSAGNGHHQHEEEEKGPEDNES